MNPSVDGVGPRYFETMGIPLSAAVSLPSATSRGRRGSRSSMKRWRSTSSTAPRRSDGVSGSAAAAPPISKSLASRRTFDRWNCAIGAAFHLYPLRTGRKRYAAHLSTCARRRAAASTGTAVRQAVQRLDANLPIFDMKTMRCRWTSRCSSSAWWPCCRSRSVRSRRCSRRSASTESCPMRLRGERGRSASAWRSAPSAAGCCGSCCREVAIMAAVGIAVGLGGALWLTRQVQAQLFGLAPSDPATLAGAGLLLAFIAIAAGYLPARRAATIDPIVSLRTE